MLLVTLPLNIVQIAAWALLPRAVGRRVSAWCFSCPAAVLVFFAEFLSGLEIEYSGDVLPEGESALIISNHLGAEFVHLFQMAWRCKMTAHVRFVQKSELKWIPINWTCYLHDHPFVKRGEGLAERDAAECRRPVRRIKES